MIWISANHTSIQYPTKILKKTKQAVPHDDCGTALFLYNPHKKMNS